MRRHGPGHGLGEEAPVHGEGRPRGDLGGPGGLEEERTHGRHLDLEGAVGVRRVLALEGVRADELPKVLGLVRGRRAHRAHLDERDVVPALGELQGRLAPGEPAADHGDVSHRRACRRLAPLGLAWPAPGFRLRLRPGLRLPLGRGPPSPPRPPPSPAPCPAPATRPSSPASGRRSSRSMSSTSEPLGSEAFTLPSVT
jgi:hypothetical protein